ncbi:MAG TPA: caspase family protein [Cyclobacteriaceae bacterium]|nr:caspase family protein [Cyclobacteriaceae bacterium]
MSKHKVSSRKLRSISFSDQSTYVSTLDVKDGIAVWTVDGFKKQREWQENSSLNLHRFYEEDKLLTLDDAGNIRRYDIGTGKDLAGAKISSGVRSACLDPSRQFVGSINKESTIEIFDIKTNAISGRIPAGKIKDIGYLGYDRFGQQLVLLSGDGKAYAWNPLNAKFLRELNLRTREYSDSRSIIHASGMNNGADRFLLASEEVYIPQGGFMAPDNRLERKNWIVAYDWTSGEEVKKMSLKYTVDGMAVGPGPSNVAYFTTSVKAVVMLNMERATVSSVVSVDEVPSCIAISPDNRYLAVGTVAGNLYLYEIVRNDPAEVRILSPKVNRNVGQMTVTESPVEIACEIETPRRIDKVFVNNNAVDYRYDGKFSAQVPLVRGKNRVRIGIRDSDSNITEKDFYLTYEPDSVIQNDQRRPANGKRVALVIGNSSYISAPPLANALNDAVSVTAVLNDLGFEVQSVYDGGYEQIKNAVWTFGDRVADADVSVFYYAGHGLEIDGSNYLIPTDANIQNALDVKQMAVPLVGILNTVEFANDEGLNIIILDACRNNPFPTGKRGGAGLARVTAPTGTLIAYATDPGATASDGDGKNGLYTGELVKQLRISQRIEDVFINTRNNVEEISSDRQHPWEEARLKGIFYLK